jgi:hypothetical protein
MRKIKDQRMGQTEGRMHKNDHHLHPNEERSSHANPDSIMPPRDQKISMQINALALVEEGSISEYRVNAMFVPPLNKESGRR